MREYRHKDAKTFHWVSFTYSGLIWVYTLRAKVWNCCSSVSQVWNNLYLQNECKGLYFAEEKRVNIIEQRYVNWLKMWNHPRFFHLIYHAFISIAHSCEINLRQLVATFNRLPVWKYVKRSWTPRVLFFNIYIALVLTFHLLFVTDNVQKWQRWDNFFPREQ